MNFGPVTNIRTIGFCAPSFGCATEPYISRFNVTVERFKQLGFEVILGPNCYLSEGVGISNTPEKCAEEFMDMYLNPAVDALITCGGGELMCEILPFIDFNVLMQATPKMVLGYSDITNIIFPLTTIADKASIYGITAGDFGLKTWHESVQDTFEVLTAGRKVVSGYDLFELDSNPDDLDPCADFYLTEKKKLTIFNGNKKTEKVEFCGRLVGGCLDSLITLCGTKYDNISNFNEKYKDNGIIWFLEACDLNVISIRRGLWQLKEAGWFKYLKGFIIGRPMHYSEPMFGVDRFEAVISVLGEFNVPVICDCDFGHLSPAFPIVSGAIGSIRAKDDDIIIEYIFE